MPRLGYLAWSALYQLELLHSRVPIDAARASLRPDEARAIDLVLDAKAYGKSIGLSATDNYETVALDWDRTIWNVTACDPLSFHPKTWWFPIVGRFPYLGFFREADARKLALRLRQRGFDVYVRTAGAYSTLGWFKDPLLVPMLSWSERDLADTIFHELAHATVWIKGSVEFNESFASFVGETAALRYLEDRHGADSEIVRVSKAETHDAARWALLQRGLYEDLDRVYQDASLSRDQKLEQKSARFASLPDRVATAGLRDPRRFLRAARRPDWNNARLIQFRTYNQNRSWFQSLYDARGGDLLAFLREVKSVTKGARDPYDALERAARREP